MFGFVSWLGALYVLCDFNELCNIYNICFSDIIHRNDEVISNEYVLFLDGRLVDIFVRYALKTVGDKLDGRMIVRV